MWGRANARMRGMTLHWGALLPQTPMKRGLRNDKLRFSLVSASPGLLHNLVEVETGALAGVDPSVSPLAVVLH